jgi:chaperonin GroES
MNAQPLANRRNVEGVAEEGGHGSGLLPPDTAREKPQRGRVVAVGPGARDEHGKQY